MNGLKIPHNEFLPIGIAGSCLGSHGVIAKGDDVLRRLSKLDLESKPVITVLLRLFLGQDDLKKLPQSQRRSPASTHVKIKVISYLCRSVVAASQGAYAVKVIFDCLLAKSATKRLQMSGMQFLTWVLNQCQPKTLKKLSPLLLQGLLRFLVKLRASSSKATGASSSPSPSSSLSSSVFPSIPSTADEKDSKSAGPSYSMHANNIIRGLIYNSVGQLAAKTPVLVNKNLNLLNLYLDALKKETDSQVQQNLHEGLSLLREAYTSATAAVKDKLRQNLLKLGLDDATPRRVRLCALQSMNRLFPFADVHARYLCLWLSADTQINIRDEARRGLQPNAMREHRRRERMTQRLMKKEEKKRLLVSAQKALGQDGSGAPATMGVDDEDEDDDGMEGKASVSQAEQEEKYPEFAELVGFIAARLKVSTSLAVTTWSTNNVVDAKVLEHMISFIQTCFEQSSKTFSKAAASSSDRAGSDKDTAKETDKAAELSHVECERLFALHLTSSGSSDALELFQQIIEIAFNGNQSELQATASASLVRLVKSSPSSFAPRYVTRLKFLRKFLLSGLPEMRLQMSKLLSLLVGARADAAVPSSVPQMPNATVAELTKELCELLESESAHLSAATLQSYPNSVKEKKKKKKGDDDDVKSVKIRNP